MSLSTRRYQVASITQNNHVYEDLVEYFRSEVSLNLRSQVNIRNASNNISNCLPLDSKPTRFYKPKSYLPSTYNTPSILPLQNQQNSTAALYKSRSPTCRLTASYKNTRSIPSYISNNLCRFHHGVNLPEEV